MKMKIKNGRLSPYTKNSITSYGIVIIAFVVVSVLNGMGLVSSTLQGQLVPICAWIVMAVSLNLVIGFSGELSLGHAGFMSVGASTGAVVSGWLLNGFDVQDTTLRLVLACYLSAREGRRVSVNDPAI